ncbi:MAG: hypothetical protein IJA19_06090 [Clostridia bacterium]|nr:hypothetical protein [Clostridia bacterium]MBQ4543721.1 hypothetical protein [Clostridia bacterium]
MLKYTICETATKAEGKDIIDYGICVYVDDNLVDGILHVSSNKKFVMKLVKMFNRGGLSLIHFKSVVEDFISRVG